MEPRSEFLSAADRTRWLNELVVAVEQARQLAIALAADAATRREARELHAQLEAIRMELEMLGRTRREQAVAGFGPHWTNPFGWPEAGKEPPP